jgi:hypothetical protein
LLEQTPATAVWRLGVRAFPKGAPSPVNSCDKCRMPAGKSEAALPQKRHGSSNTRA